MHTDFRESMTMGPLSRNSTYLLVEAEREEA